MHLPMLPAASAQLTALREDHQSDVQLHCFTLWISEVDTLPGAE